MGDGTFGTPVQIDTCSRPFPALDVAHLNVADLNRDGFLDVVVPVCNAGLSAYLGNGDGTFEAAPFGSPGVCLGGGELADLNTDGILDFVSFGPSCTGVMWGSGADGVGNGGFFEIAIYQTFPDCTGNCLKSGALVDLNGDGSLDIAGAATDQITAALQGRTADGAPVGVFDRVAGYPAWSGAIDFAQTAADLNSDGTPDLVVVAPGGDARLRLARNEAISGPNIEIVSTATPSTLTDPFSAAGMTTIGNALDRFGSAKALDQLSMRIARVPINDAEPVTERLRQLRPTQGLVPLTHPWEVGAISESRGCEIPRARALATHAFGSSIGLAHSLIPVQTQTSMGKGSICAARHSTNSGALSSSCPF